eukprot:TRINITY_DN8577_c0_g1_i3.p1 TRINITY_DN8577_c0_g1~~TRINITY_DN8577_c0_g1_i3.p1  ORF type:complete len:455 (-),score=80.54 TRINITY_DN8577_c0_g1_i3:1255-2559(-)
MCIRDRYQRRVHGERLSQELFISHFLTMETTLLHEIYIFERKATKGAAPKTEEEINRLTVDESIGMVERAQIFLSKGEPPQKAWVLRNLDILFREHNGIIRLFPWILEHLTGVDSTCQIEASKSFIKLLKAKIFKKEDLLELFELTLHMLQLWEEEVLEGWMRVFEEMLRLLPKEKVQKDVREAIAMLHSSQPAYSKATAARMIGVFTEVYKERCYDSNLFDKLRALLREEGSTLRLLCAKEVMPRVIKTIDPSILETCFFDSIIELCMDNNLDVRSAGIELIVECGDYLESAARSCAVAKFLAEMLLNSANEGLNERLSFHFGRIIYNFRKFLSCDQILWTKLMNLFNSYAGSLNVTLKKNFVFNVPGVLLAGGDFAIFENSYRSLFQDKREEIRLVCIATFAEVITSTFGIRSIGLSSCWWIFAAYKVRRDS